MKLNELLTKCAHFQHIYRCKATVHIVHRELLQNDMWTLTIGSLVASVNGIADNKLQPRSEIQIKHVLIFCLQAPLSVSGRLFISRLFDVAAPPGSEGRVTTKPWSITVLTGDRQTLVTVPPVASAPRGMFIVTEMTMKWRTRVLGAFVLEKFLWICCTKTTGTNLWITEWAY